MIMYSVSNWYRRGGMGTYLAGTSRVLNAIIGHYLILVWVPVHSGTVYTSLPVDQYSAEGFAGCFGPVDRCGHSHNSWNLSQIYWTHDREHGIKRGLPSWMAWYSARDSTFSFEASRRNPGCCSASFPSVQADWSFHRLTGSKHLKKYIYSPPH